MKSKIIHLADSPTIPVPQPLLDVCHLQNEVEMEAQGGCLVIRGLKPVREGWEEAFRMAAKEDDKMILNEAAQTRWDEEEWEW